MSLILLADDSPHALRMGEKILRDEGHEVESVSHGDAALARLEQTDPDLLIADFFLPGRSGLDLCRKLKQQGRLTRVILTAGMLETVNESEAVHSGMDAIVRKPFEATAILETVTRLAEQVRKERRKPDLGEADRVRTLVEQALKAEMPRVAEEVTARVLAQLKSN